MNSRFRRIDDAYVPLAEKEQQALCAGDFSAWLRHARKALLHDCGTDVDCGECIGCCSSSYFIHIKPLERNAIARIRKELLFPAPGQSKGHVLMGHDEYGLCPMLVSGKCSIYEHRPQTCRNYDCRVFTAAGIAAGGKDKAVINERVRSWRFSYPTDLDRDEHLAVQAASAFMRGHANCFPGGRVPSNPSQLAILAIKAYAVFLNSNVSSVDPKDAFSDTDIANAVIEACKEFDARIRE